jgi:hypothetical protein
LVERIDAAEKGQKERLELLAKTRLKLKLSGHLRNHCGNRKTQPADFDRIYRGRL